MVVSLLERYGERIVGVLSCYDRVLIQGTLPGLCYAQGMTSFLDAHQIRIFDYPQFAQSLRDEIRDNAERLARDHGIEILFVRNSRVRKEEIVAKVLQQRGQHPGLVCILSAMECCPAYRPVYDAKSGRCRLRGVDGKCLHYYFYFLDQELGLCYIRVPTWCPFRLQVYFNGHAWLARRLDAANLTYDLRDNAFVAISDWAAAQRLADDLDPVRLHQILDRYALLCCPVIASLGVGYHYSLMQLEYATDVVFKRAADLSILYQEITRTAIHTVKAADIATFLGRPPQGPKPAEVGSRFNTRLEGTRIKHQMGPTSIKMYDKLGTLLRIEVTVNDVAFFKHHRLVEHKDGTSSRQLASFRKTIYSLPELTRVLVAANRRYLEFISALEDPTPGVKNLRKLSNPSTRAGRTYRGLNFFSSTDQQLLEVIARGELVIAGVRNQDLRGHLPGTSSGQISRSLKRLRVLGVLKRVAHSYKYYLTKLGRLTIAAAFKLRDLLLVPALIPAPAK